MFLVVHVISNKELGTKNLGLKPWKMILPVCLLIDKEHGIQIYNETYRRDGVSVFLA